MGDKNNPDVGGDREDCSQQSPGPVPPPEAFQQLERLHRSQDPNVQDSNKHNGQEGKEQPETSVASAATTKTAMQAPRRPSLPMQRRRSSLFGQLPSRSKSRLFDDIVTSNSNFTNKNHGNAIVDDIVAETMMTSATNFSRSQSTWLQEDHQSTLFGRESFSDGGRSGSPTRNPKPQEPTHDGKSSLFGAVMKQFGSSISSALPAPPSSPFGNKRRWSSGGAVNSSSPQTNVGNVGGGEGGFRGLMASPSGKTIMNIVNQFNSPFKFQSPSSSHRKRQRRRRLWGEEEDDDDDKYKDNDTTEFVTPKKRQRVQVEDEDDNSKPNSNILFLDHDNNDSRSSLGGGLVDEHWREAPIIDTDDETGSQMELLDWSLATKVRIEVHGGSTRQQPAPCPEDAWIRDAMRENEEAFTYWMYQSAVSIEGSIGTSQTSGVLAHNTSNSNLAVSTKSIGTTKPSMSRQGSFSSSRLDAKIPNGKSKTKNKKGNDSDLSSSANRLAKYLIQSVRGPHAKYSRKRVLEENSWWREPMTPIDHREGTTERSQRQWRQALRSLFSNYRRRVLRKNNPRDSLNTIVLESYFYCIGQDHAVLFRIAAGRDRDSNCNDDDSRDKAVPVVLVSSTSDAFRKQLESNGMDLTSINSDDDESFQLLESIQEREARERQKIAAATAAAVRKNSRINVLLSPGVRADLEALRRAQAFGESAGADVMVKVKKSGAGADEDGKGNENLPKAIRISGWENVSLFLEVYLNLFGDTMGSGDNTAKENSASTAPLSLHVPKASNKRLPLLICPNANGIGPFEHASLKSLRLFPVERVPAAGSNKGEPSTTHGNAIEICGIVLPCAVRKLLLVTRNRILEDEKIASASNSSRGRVGSKQMSSAPQPRNDNSDSSKYVVLHSTRPSIANNNKEAPKSWIGGLNGSLILNQGKKRKSNSNDMDERHSNGSDSDQGQVFECSYGMVVSMAVWDTSREEVAACKLDSAFPENWFHKK